MAFNGYLIKLGGASGDVLPMKFISASSYSCTPDQRMESKANRAVTGLLHRTTLEHTATKIEFNTTFLTNRERKELNDLIAAHWVNQLERKITINYYDDATDSYKNADCYMPDVKYEIEHINLETNTIYYNPVRYAFIEY